MKNSIVRRKLIVAFLLASFAEVVSATSDTRIGVATRPTDGASTPTLADSRLLLLRAGTYDPATERLETMGPAYLNAKSSRYAVVQFHPASLSSGRKSLSDDGVDLVSYLPNNAYIVRLNGKTLEEIRLHPFVRAAEFHLAIMKIDPRLWPSERNVLLQQMTEGLLSERALLDNVSIRGFAGESAAAIAVALKKLVPGARIERSSERPGATPYVHAAVGRDHLDVLLAAASAQDAVAYIEPWHPTLANNAGSVGAIQGNSVGACGGAAAICGPSPIWAQGIFGTNQIVAILDSGTTPWAAHFTTLDKGLGAFTAITLSDNPAPVPPAVGNRFPDRKIVAYWLQPNGPTNYDYNSGHGTHTAGTVAGDLAGTFNTTTYVASTPLAANHELADGMAPNAQLIVQDAGGVDPQAIYVADLAGTLMQAYAGGSRIHNDSWGGATGGAYTELDAEADRVLWTSEDLLAVFAAGNSGPVPGQVGSPGNAKNVLSVAALGHAGETYVAAFSSRGPAADGRLKPDIAAPGVTIWSASASTFSAVPRYTGPTVMSGTSMAAPTISGNAALMRQYFADGFYPRGVRTAEDAYNPSGVVMKAVLLNGTNPLGGSAWPNPDSGWGRAWLDGNLWFKNTASGGDDRRRMRIFERTRSSGLKTGEVQEYALENVSADSELRATLTWFDPEASGGAAFALVNNLDLEVVAPDGTIFNGNVFHGGASTPGGVADMINNVEQVRLPTAPPGRYVLRVKASSVPGNGRLDTDRQGYGLVVSGAFGLPDPAPLAAPSAPSVAGNDQGGVSIAFGHGGGSQQFLMYRAAGTCASADPGAFRMVQSGTSSPLRDQNTQGGEHYAYKVRGVSNDIEGLVSTCVDVVSADDCTLRPTILATSLVGSGLNADCRVELNWQDAAPTCVGAAGGITYTVERSNDAFIADVTIVANGLVAPEFSDTSVEDGRSYFYRFRATDSLGNVSEHSNIATVTPSGTSGPDPSNFRDNVDTSSYMEWEAAWGISGHAAADGNLSYHTGGPSANYSDQVCASIETPVLTVPVSAELSFSAKYNLEYGWDGVVTEISINDGATWVDLPPQGGYPMALNTGTVPPVNACGFWDGKGVYSGVSTSVAYAAPGNDTAVAVFKPFAIDLSGYAGQAVKIRWRFSSDPAANYSGFFLDKVRMGERGLLFRSPFDYSQYMCR